MKFTDIKVQNCLFMYQIEQNNALATSFLALHSKDKHNDQTRSATQNLLDVPLSRTNKNASEYQYIRDWNNFKKKFPQIPENKLSHMKIKRILKQAILINTEHFYSPPTSIWTLCYFCFLYLRVIQLTPYFMILLVLIMYC